ncbi:MAG: hypothetical protein ACTSVB_08820 [Candidatus Heimdallarchaeaceae archaeon]
MNGKYKLLSYLLLISCLSVIFHVSVVDAASVRTLSVDIHEIIIDDAYYIDTDIYTYLTVNVDTGSTTEKYYLVVTLTNPLNEESTVMYHVFSSLKSLKFEVIFYNHATVSGDYIVEASIITNNNGWLSVTDVMIFDPPGGSEGDPYVGIKVI